MDVSSYLLYFSISDLPSKAHALLLFHVIQLLFMQRLHLCMWAVGFHDKKKHISLLGASSVFSKHTKPCDHLLYTCKQNLYSATRLIHWLLFAVIKIFLYILTVQG